MSQTDSGAGIDGRFVARMREGNPAARDLLYRRFSRRVLAYLTLVVADPELARDLTHDVFVKAFEAAGRFDGEPAAIAAWLLAIAHNTAVDHARRSRRVVAEAPESIGRLCERAGAPSDRADDESDLRGALARLSTPQRTVLALRYDLGMDARQAGDALGKSADAVRHIEQRALRSLRARLEPARHCA